MAEKKDVKLQVFVTASMDDKLDDMSQLMGMSKNELVRFAIATLVGGWNKSVEIASHEFIK